MLFYWPAAVHRTTALRWYGIRRDRAKEANTVFLAIDAERSITRLRGVEVERVRHVRDWLAPFRYPPRVTIEFALLKVASDRDLEGAIAVLADACAQRKTSPEALLNALAKLPRLAGRAALVEVLGDVADGAHSVLERRYLREVEQAHGLPTGLRQVDEISGAKRVRRDVKYADHSTLVELDGQFGHRDSEDRWNDLDRDLAAAASDTATVRLGWSQVLLPCRVAGAIATILQAGGWSGHPVPCGPDCSIGDRVGKVSAGDSKSPQSGMRARL